MSSYKSKMSATEKEICFGHIQKHLNAQSTKSVHFSDGDSAPIAMSESSFKGQGKLHLFFISHPSFIHLSQPSTITHFTPSLPQSITVTYLTQSITATRFTPLFNLINCCNTLHISHSPINHCIALYIPPAVYLRLS